MLKFPQITGELARQVRGTVLEGLPPGLAAKTDTNLAFDMAVHAVNSAMTAGQDTLNRMMSADPMTRAVALIMFLKIMDAQVGAAQEAFTRTIAKMAVDAMVGEMTRGL